MIKVDIDTRTFDRRLHNLTRRISRLETPLRKFGHYLKEETERQFETQTDPDGKRWAALAPSTLEEKRRLGFPDAILTRTGALKRSIYFTASGKTLTFGLTAEYAGYHQTGTSRMPQRRIVGINSKRFKVLIAVIKSSIGL